MKTDTTIFDTKNGFYSPHFFNIWLRDERRRTERSGSPFSLLTLDISDLADAIKKRPKLKLQQIKTVITNIVQENTRHIDIKTWYDDTKLKILMPETPLSGANALASKLQKKINNGFMTPFGINHALDREKNFHIISYPEVVTNSEASSESERLVAKKSVAISSNSRVSNGENTQVYKMQWSLPDQMSLTRPLYSDLFEGSALFNLQKWIKRAIDIIGALIGILLFSPFMLIIAILIKMTSSGPILHRQERTGFLRKKFIFLKFRSMYAGCDENSHKKYVTDFINNKDDKPHSSSRNGQLYKMQDDTRITPFGRFLRRSSLDELPQLLNVLKGDMSLAGPRPPIAYEVEKYESWHLRRVVEVKPGITGLWQVKGRSTTTFNEMVRLDIAYVNNWSLWLDFKIIVRTIWAVISAKGAY
jgi:lipopolysaccharide/colanic/teichoic acid biosynthesis glycosyltransferase/GGDEF domain-containing protein